MVKRFMRRFAAFAVAVIMLFSACAPKGNTNDTGSAALTWGTWAIYNGHKKFLDLLNETYPDIKLEFVSYMGANRTRYSWEQMRADDISDIFITSQILDEELVKERLVDLSEYPFINNLSDAVLDQYQIDGGIYLLPVSYSMYGIFYNKTLMQEKGWELPSDFAELESLCAQIKEEGMIPGVIATQLTGGPFSAVFNLAKTDWFSTPEGAKWEQAFLAGNASAEGRWESTMEYVQKYIDIGMFTADPEDRDHDILVQDYLGNRKAVFCTAVHAISRNTAKKDGGDEIGMMPYISKDGSKNVYMYSPQCFFGISKRLTEPGNEKKLEDAIKIMSLLFSQAGQETMIDSNSAVSMGVLDNAILSDASIIQDAKQALKEGRVFNMTYAHWDNVLADMGQAYKEWFCQKDGVDGKQCILRMDKLQQSYLNEKEQLNFCESTADFTLEQTAGLVGQALGAAAETDAVMVPIGAFHDGKELSEGISGKLYKGKINMEISNTICPQANGEYAVMEMTGAQAKSIAAAGFDKFNNGNPFAYLLVTRNEIELEDNTPYKIAFFMGGYTEAAAQTYSAEVHKGSIREYLSNFLKEQKTVSPGQNMWK